MVQASNGTQSGGGVDVLANVELVSFSARPPQIGPFGASRLEWKVRGPELGFSVRLNGAAVARNGQEIVQPPQTAAYRLSAVSAGVTKFLGIVTVEVDQSACQINSPVNAETTIRSFLIGQLGGRPDVKLSSNPSVTFSAGTIEFGVQFAVGSQSGGLISGGGEATIAASLGLRIRGGHVMSDMQSISSDVSFGFTDVLAGLFSATASKAMDQARADVAKAAQDLVTGLGELIDGLVMFPPGFIKNSVSIGVDDQGHGTIDVQACPNDLLVALSELSTNVSGE
jgi:hypothetical protein